MLSLVDGWSTLAELVGLRTSARSTLCARFASWWKNVSSGCADEASFRTGSLKRGTRGRQFLARVVDNGLVLGVETTMRARASEFPNDNRALHRGAVWVTPEPCAPWESEALMTPAAPAVDIPLATTTPAMEPEASNRAPARGRNPDRRCQRTGTRRARRDEHQRRDRRRHRGRDRDRRRAGAHRAGPSRERGRRPLRDVHSNPRRGRRRSGM